MSRTPCIVEVESSYLKKDVPSFNIGDTVRVQTRILEGEKERLQAFTGTVVAKKGTGLSETFTVYRTAYGSSMERVFLLHSPRVADVEVMRSGKVRRAKLYYLRGRSGKAAKVREQFVGAEARKTAVQSEA
ncbi:MAG: 50S ribosomal protein L19 [Chlamydiae bacterium]|nr:50S ribosomal protein L19 [Chlamydiota bacterium]